MTKKSTLPIIQQHMIEKFQCHGCVRGFDVGCGTLKLLEHPAGHFVCTAHIAGIIAGPEAVYCLGLPNGFRKVGAIPAAITTNIRLWSKASGKLPQWDDFNLPVWALEQDGYLFVRTYCPRSNVGWVDVIEGGTFAITATCARLPINVSAFVHEID